MLRIKNHILNFFLDRLSDYEIEEAFKEYITIFIIFLLTVFGLIAIIPSVISAIQEGKFFILFFILLAYSIIPFLLIKKKITYKVRSHFLCFAMFLCGFVVMFNAPLVSSARLWFLCVTVVSCLLINGTASLFYFILSLIALLGAGYNNSFNLLIPIEQGPTVWHITIGSYSLITVIVVSSAYFILLGMKKAESELKRSSAFKTNLELIQQIEEINQMVDKISEEYYSVLNSINSQIDAALGETENIRLVNNLNNIRELTSEAKKLSQGIVASLPKQNLY
jgi:hypothetical protein